MCFKTPRLETQLLSLNSSSVSPRPAASGLEDARQPAQPQAGSNLAGPAGENPEHSAGSPRASPRLGAEGEPGRRKGQPGPSSAQLARRPRGEWQRRRARCQRRGAEPRALVGAGSEAGRAGRGRRRGRCRALELRARGEESRAAGAELEEAAAYGWQRVGDGELGSRTAGGSELGQGLIGAVRARGCRCSLGPAEEGSRPAGEVGGGSGSGCVLGRGRRCVRAATAALFLSPAAASPSAEPSRGKRAGRRPPCRWHLPPSGQARVPFAASVPACSRLPRGSVSLVLFRAGCARRREHSSPELQANSGFRHLSVTVHFPEGSPSLPAAVFRSPSAEESSLTAAFAIAGRISAFPRALRLHPGLCPGSSPGRAGVPGARPRPPPFEVCLPPLPGLCEVRKDKTVPGFERSIRLSFQCDGAEVLVVRRDIHNVQLACGVPRSSQATDGQRDESVRKDRASPGASAWSRRVDESLKRKPVGGPRPQRRRALT
uniref:Uncharacterized protein n=1 Tax=Rangifer tarandus platyrhynchus TaxID=3082113 RepID=A0ACB0E5A8_RANTA|nr:unnamed protein product [Rangifer tarandus platyrhynchus]